MKSCWPKAITWLILAFLTLLLQGCVKRQDILQNIVDGKQDPGGTIVAHDPHNFMVHRIVGAFGSPAKVKGIPLDAFDYLYRKWGSLNGDEPYFSALVEATVKSVEQYGTALAYYVGPPNEDGMTMKMARIIYQNDQNHLTIRFWGGESLYDYETGALDLTHFKNSLNGRIASTREIIAGQSDTEPSLPEARRVPNANSDVGSRWSFAAAPYDNHDAVAVVIGNRNYAGEGHAVPNAEFAINDAIIIKEYLVQSLGYSTDNVLYLEDASQADLMSVFGTKDEPQGRLYDKVRKDRSDVFVYYSGHGAPSLNSGRGFLLPVDADPNKVAINGYSLETLYTNLNQVPAKSMTVMIDANFSGSTHNGAVVKNASSIALKLVDTQNQLADAVVLNASDVSEIASWDDEKKHSLFTRYFLEGVTGAADGEGFGNSDGKVTLSELKSFLQEEVPHDARQLHGRDQHPQVSGDKTRVFAVIR